MQFKKGDLAYIFLGSDRKTMEEPENKHWYPPDNIIGIITEVYPGTCKVHWPHNTVDAPYEWYAPECDLRPVVSFKIRFTYWLFKIIHNRR